MKVETVDLKKEADSIGRQPLNVARSWTFTEIEEIKQKILALFIKETEKGIKHRSTLKRVRNKIRTERRINASHCTLREEITYPRNGTFRT